MVCVVTNRGSSSTVHHSMVHHPGPPHLLPPSSSATSGSSNNTHDKVKVMRPPPVIHLIQHRDIYHVMVLHSINIDASKIICVFQQAFGTTHDSVSQGWCVVVCHRSPHRRLLSQHRPPLPNPTSAAESSSTCRHLPIMA